MIAVKRETTPSEFDLCHLTYLDLRILGDIAGYRGQGASKVGVALTNQSGHKLGDGNGSLEIGTDKAFAFEVLKVVAHKQVEEDGGLRRERRKVMDS